MSFESILNLVYFASFFILFLYGQRLQSTLMLVNVRRSLNKLDRFRANARLRLLSSMQRYNTNRADVETRMDRVTSSFAITPVSMDPSGIIGKLEHVLDTYDDLLKTEVQRVAPNANEAEINTLSNQLEVSIGLDTMFRVVRHYYLLAKKQGGILALAQLQMALPTIMEEAEAYSAAIDAFATGKPIGDGAGPLVATRLAMGTDGKEAVKDTMVYDVPFEGRNMMVIRAKGPGGNVGKPGSLVEKLIQEKGPVSLVMTVDAALKLEGELSGDVAEGVGAAIGGPGTEKYHIEVSAVKQGIPLVAVVVKMSSKEAISTITSQLEKGVEEAAKRVKNIILARTKPGDNIIVAGIGNTIGVA
ncbi:DUF1512 domain-containing protein [Candidatus Bathyarchaeota archaeon]|nr:MAG: DUF1512 domain-containing protein [Candidatus Bathyarchaeota archaeon]TMI30819.1 MAG: DUF1512 domain-containing protein [Candidatus Bathyarchaeota archaeon]